MADVTLEAARLVKDKALEHASRQGLVVGVGITKVGSDYAVKVNFSAQPQGAPPAEIDGVPIVYETVGPLTPR
jgi:hypothetical protein